MKSQTQRPLELFATFFKIGAFTFGGGYAMIPLIQNEVVERRGWITADDILDIVAIAESTPGPIAINFATFVGYKICGFWGAFCATMGVVLPSFGVIFAISFILRQFSNLPAVQFAFQGIRAGVLALIIKSLVSMYRQCPKNPVAYCIAGAAFLCAAFFHINTILIILGCAGAGLLASLAAKRRAQ